MTSAPGDEAGIRRTIAVLAVCGFSSTFAMRFVDPMIGVISRDLAEDPLRVALLASAFALPYALVQPVLGPVGDALGKERVMKVCLLLLTVTLFAAALATDLAILVGLRILSGAAAGGVMPLALATIGDRVGMAERQVALSRFLLFAISGQLLGSTSAGLLAEAVGWRGAFVLAGLLSAASVATIVLGFRHSVRAATPFSFGEAARLQLGVLALGRARALMAFVFVEGLVIFGIQPYIAPLLEERGVGGAAEAGLIIAAFATGGIIYTLTVRSLLRVLGLGRMLRLAGVLAGLAFVVLSPGQPWPVQAGAMLAVGVGFYMLHNSFQTQMTEVAPTARGSAVSMHAFCYFTGQAIGPALYGLGLRSIGAGPTLLLAAGGILVLAFLAARVIGQPRAR